MLVGNPPPLPYGPMPPHYRSLAGPRLSHSPFTRHAGTCLLHSFPSPIRSLTHYRSLASLIHYRPNAHPSPTMAHYVHPVASGLTVRAGQGLKGEGREQWNERVERESDG